MDEHRDFPFPFDSDMYRYSINLRRSEEEPVVVDKWYVDEVSQRRALLDSSHGRCFQANPLTNTAQWEVLRLGLASLARQKPAIFTLCARNDLYTFSNIATGEALSFRMWDDESLAYEPLDLLGRHVQEDLLILTEREGDLFLDAGSVCFPANWSFPFDVGMSYTQIHSPVPYFGKHLAPKAQAFLGRISSHEQWSRLNWTMTVGRRLDTAAEKYHLWKPDSLDVTAENVGDLVHLRVEVQKFLRLPISNLLLFTIRTYMKPIAEIAQVEPWCRRMVSVLDTLPGTIAEYKAIADYAELVRDYCSARVTSVVG